MKYTLKPGVKIAAKVSLGIIYIVCVILLSVAIYEAYKGMDKRLTTLENRPLQQRVVIVTPTPMPTASPSAAIKRVYSLPVKPTVK